MEERHPRTLRYLERFEALLRARPAYRRYFRERDPWWSVFDVGFYTLAPWKVVWPSIARDLRAAVAGPLGARPVVPQHTVTLAAVESEEEAHYLCGVLNSGPPGAALRLFASAGGKGFAGPHVLRRVRVPRYRADDPLFKKFFGGE